MRLILALAVFVASFGVVTSGRPPAARELRIAANGARPEPGFTAIVQPPVRWSPVDHRRRTPQPSSDNHPAIVCDSSASIAPERGLAAEDVPQFVDLANRSRGPASPRAPPRQPAS